MRMAFEVTVDDVEIVLDRESFKKRLTDANLTISTGNDDAERIFDELDTSAIEKAALCGDSMDEQTKFAQDEMETQIVELIAEWERE